MGDRNVQQTFRAIKGAMELEKGACASLNVEENGKCSIKTNHSPVNEAKIPDELHSVR